MKTFRDLWKNAFRFKGCAARKEFFLSLLVTDIAMIVCLPVLGFLMTGLAKADPSAPKRCFLTRLALVILLAALGGFLWCAPLYGFSVGKWSLIATGALCAGTVGIILCGIGGMMDRIRLQKADVYEDAENTQ